ncbi:MAG: type IV secretory system conjugative DNA transfer family protein [Oscillospiraceae bacterium]
MKKNKTLNIVMYTLVSIMSAFFCGHVSRFLNSGMSLFLAIEEAIVSIQETPLDCLHFNIVPFVIVGTCIILFAVYNMDAAEKRKMTRRNIEHGSAEFLGDLTAYNKKFTSPFGKVKNDGEDNMIITGDMSLSMNARKTLRNNNILIVGGSGTGKTRFFIKPNILQANASFVVTDPSGEIIKSVGPFLESQGYKIRVFNLVQMEHSCSYNPFHYIRNEEDVMNMINMLIRNTTPTGASKGDPFWEKSETALLQAICYYLWAFCPKDEQNFSSVMTLLRMAEIKEDDSDFESPLDLIFKDIRDVQPEHISVRQYDIYKQAAGKTAKSILISCSVRLALFNLPAVERLTNQDTMELGSVGDEKTAIFCVTPLNSTTFNFIVTMMYSQLFDTLYYHAEYDCPHNLLPVGVRFLLDEFANIGELPDFEKKLSTMRKYGISCSIILQNMAQLKTMYKDTWETVTGNCDTFLFLGGQEQTTLELVSKKLGKQTIMGRNSSQQYGSKGSVSSSLNLMGRELMTPDEVGKMDTNLCIAFVRGISPYMGEKYDYTKHKNYKFTGDADSKNEYDLSAIETPELPQTMGGLTDEIEKSDISLASSLLERTKTSAGLSTFEIGDAEDSLNDLEITEDTDINELVKLEDAFDPDTF